ncbi:MAG: GHKL domain-containing protein [Clostridia bacterium]|nr:GHKL domain-containing protein [Clostridia bacterium]
MFFADELCGALSLWVILRFIFLKRPVRSPALYITFGLLFAANAFLFAPFLARFLYDFDGFADIVTAGLLIASSYALFKDRRQFKTLFTVIIYDATVEMFYSLIAPYLSAAPWLEELCCALLHLTVGAIVFLAAKRSVVNVLPEVFSDIPKWIWAVLLLFELTCYYKEFGEAASWYGVLYTGSSATVILCVLYLVFKILRLIRRQNGIIEQLDAQRAYGETLRTGDEELRRFRHDYKNHMIVVNALLAAGKTDEAREYLSAIDSTVDCTVRRISTGNFVADAIINSKAVAAAKSNAPIEFTGTIPAQGIRNEDLCTVLSNLLDNAIEAVSKSDVTDKTIRIGAGIKGESFFMRITNSAVPTNINGSFATTKRDRLNHGIGLRNVRRTVEAYYGKLNLKNENGVFTAELMMLLQ